MPDLSDAIAVAKDKIAEIERRIWCFRTHVDPEGFELIKIYVQAEIEYQLLLAQKEPIHA
jgi:hypothetical protein